MPMFYFFKGALGFNTYTGLILGYLLVNATFYINVIKCDRKKQKKKKTHREQKQTFERKE